MADNDDQNTSSPSTKWEWKQVKMRPAPQARSHAPSAARVLRTLIPWPARRAMNVTIKYRGGPECWYEITARGVTIRRPGSVAIHDAVKDLWGGTIR